MRAICGVTDVVTAVPTIATDPLGELPSANPGTAETERAMPTSARFDIVTVVSRRAIGWFGVNDPKGNGNTNNRRPDVHVTGSVVNGCGIGAPLQAVPPGVTAATGEPTNDIVASTRPSSIAAPGPSAPTELIRMSRYGA